MLLVGPQDHKDRDCNPNRRRDRASRVAGIYFAISGAETIFAKDKHINLNKEHQLTIVLGSEF